MKKPLDVYIIGTAYSGSTFLSNLLNAHSSIFSAGELSGYYDDYPIGAHDLFCPVCASKGQPCPIFSPDFKSQLNAVGKGKANQLIRQKTGKEIIVDASKFTTWLTEVLKERTQHKILRPILTPIMRKKIKVLVLFRSPYGYYASVKRREQFSQERILTDWLSLYQHSLSFLNDKKIDYIQLNFEGLLAQPESECRRICEFLGITFEPTMIEFWRQEPPHSLGGNAGSYMWFEDFAKRAEFATEQDRIQADNYRERQYDVSKTETWRQKLSMEEIEQINQFPGIKTLCDRLGIAMEQPH